MKEQKIGDYCYYLPKLYEIRSIVRHQLYRFVGVTSNKRYGVPLMQLHPPKIVHGRNEKQQRMIDNSEML